jgi:hypothetical protein
MSEQLDLQQFRDLIASVRDGRKVGYEQLLLSSLAACVHEIERVREMAIEAVNHGEHIARHHDTALTDCTGRLAVIRAALESK